VSDPGDVFSQLQGVSWFRALATGLVASYLAIGVLLYFQQDSLLFPAPKVYEKSAPHLPFEDLHIPVNRTDSIHAWWIPAASAKVILMFHGNGYVLEEMATDEAVSLHEIGANLLLVDYRGYGGSTPLTPNESTVQADARAALAYLTTSRGISAANIYVLGRSIGSGPATQLAVDNPVLGGLVLESPFSSIDDAAQAMSITEIYPIHWMLRTHFNNLSKIAEVRMPVLVICGTADTLTPAWMAKAIFARANQPKKLDLIPNAGHNDLLLVGGQALTKALKDFVGL
jgi:pimeloyl-ACP methyl ester carboxylesterase